MTNTTNLQEKKDAGRAIIINVDDLGLSPAINQAVIRLAGRGLIGATSFMAGGTVSADEVQSLREVKVDIGLHLDFTGIFPTSLKRPLPALITASYARQLNKAAVTDAIKQQFDAFETTFNKAPVFVDGHQHVHQLPTIRQCLIDEITSRYGAENLSSARVTTPLIRDAKSQIIYRLGGKAWQRLCAQQQVKTNDYFAGVYDFDANRDELEALWQQWLSAAPTTNYLAAGLHMCQPDLEPRGTYAQYGSTTPPIHSVPLGLPRNIVTTLIMCHPAVAGHDWQDEIKAAREREFAWLMSYEFEQLLEDYQVRLVKWSELAA
ncbi:ChbG/HpnK family deacetylase [Psychrobacter ciconiae]|uniref:ChbG/HpnK family deacetylase n=1 Tax=Psychrobacter ciconiae TaxID=1553449 RepID=UPI001918C6DA|nr:ChbG/HpnK family deacetylase [Psychrobacter ciconiae]